MTLPAYVLQLLTNATEPVSALSGEQARAIRLADGLRGFLVAVATPATGHIGRGGGIYFKEF